VDAPQVLVIHRTSRRVVAVISARTIALTPLRMCLCVGKTESGSPGNAQHHPTLDALQFAQRFDIGDQIAGGVGTQVGIGLVRRRPAAAGTALIEQDHAVGVRIEVLPLPWARARARAAVQVDGGRAGRIPTGLPVDPVPVTNIEQTTVVGLDERESVRHIGQATDHERGRTSRLGGWAVLATVR